MTRSRLLVVGDLCADIVVHLDSSPRFGQREQIVSGTTVVLGGSSAITACGAAAMSVPTSLVSSVGDDALGGFLLQELQTRGVDAGSCRVDGEAPTGSSTILTLPDGDRSILTALGSIGRVRVGDIPETLLSQSAHVHVGSYFLQDGLHGELADLYRQCRAQGISTSLDPNDDPCETWDSGIVDVLPEVDLFFCNEQEALAISRTRDLDRAVAWFAQRLPTGAELVLKLGPLGARVAACRDGDVAETYAASPESVTPQVVDTVGAGDSLAAGYLAARLRRLPVEHRLRIGVRNGTASTRAAGGVAAQLTWSDVS